MPSSKAFPPRQLHWRLADSAAEYCLNRIESGLFARRITRWAEDFKPQLLWIFPELRAVDVGIHLAKMLRVPVHATVHDAHELAGFFVIPSSCVVFYLRSVCRLFQSVSSIDTISNELLDHVSTKYRGVHSREGVVVPPSIPLREMIQRGEGGPGFDNNSRRILFCGAARESEAQWCSFVNLLAELPFLFQVTAFSSPEFFHKSNLPKNVSVAFHPYVESGSELITIIGGMKFHAAYLGLWREAQLKLFAQTSLSSKLATYVAAGVPVIIDAPEDSVAWRLTCKYGAGILLKDEGAVGSKDGNRGQMTSNSYQVSNVEQLKMLFSDDATWLRMAKGSARMCRDEFDLNVNAERLREILARTAESAGNLGE